MKKMKKYLILFIAASLLLAGCNPTNKVFKHFISKKYRNALEEERKNNAQTIDALKLDTSVLNTTIKGLINDKTELQKKYDSLLNSSMTQEERLKNSLLSKSEELKNKEKLIAEKVLILKDLYAKLNKQDSISKALNNTVKNALMGFNPDELTIELKNGKIYVSMTDKLLFKSGSAKVEAKGKTALKKLADILIKNPDIEILIEGHTDNVPIKNDTYKDNWDLSAARAISIVRILHDEYKVTPAKLTAAGRGEYFPKASNDTPEGKAKNRRTEIILSPKLEGLFKLIQ